MAGAVYRESRKDRATQPAHNSGNGDGCGDPEKDESLRKLPLGDVGARVWRSLFAVMACILAENGSSAFDLPHVGKEAEKNVGEAVWEVPVRSRLVTDAARF